MEDERPREEAEELWDQEEPLVRATPNVRMAKQRTLRRSVGETGLATAVHLCLLVYYMCVHVHDRTLFKRCKDPDLYFEGWNTYGGRWKYLTYVNMWIQLICYFLGFFSDIMPPSQAKVWFHKLYDFVFTSLGFPSAALVFLLFWGISAVDQDLVYPAVLHEYHPKWIHHSKHTFILPVALLEAVLVFHRYPSNLKAAFFVFMWCNFYVMWLIFTASKVGTWPYKFLEAFSPVQFVAFCAVSTLVGYLLYLLGKCVSSLRWKDRLQALDELRSEDHLNHLKEE